VKITSGQEYKRNTLCGIVEVIIYIDKGHAFKMGCFTGIVPVEEGGNRGSGIYQLPRDFCAAQGTD
jgi:hypothetical protein